MNVPLQTRPVIRQAVPEADEQSRESSFYGDNSRVAFASDQGGVKPLGYADCYRLRGAAQDMCLGMYF